MKQTPKQSAPLAFEVANVAKAFHIGDHHIQVLTQVDLAVKRGEWVALVGASGSGKTTLLHLLGGLDKPDDGDIRCFGRRYCPDPRYRDGANPGRLQKWCRETTRSVHLSMAASQRRQRLGFVFQAYHLLPELTALENVALPGLQWAANRKKVYTKAQDLLVDFGLAERLLHRPRELSGGEQQRVALARALINDPDAILADEPTGNLDQQASEQIMGLLQTLNRGAGKTIVMVTHDLELAGRGDRIFRLEHGKAHPAPPDTLT